MVSQGSLAQVTLQVFPASQCHQGLFKELLHQLIKKTIRLKL